jgi:hypothetical protein
MSAGSCPRTWDRSEGLNFAAQPEQLERFVNFRSISPPIHGNVAVSDRRSQEKRPAGLLPILGFCPSFPRRRESNLLISSNYHTVCPFRVLLLDQPEFPCSVLSCDDLLEKKMDSRLRGNDGRSSIQRFPVLCPVSGDCWKCSVRPLLPKIVRIY